MATVLESCKTKRDTYVSQIIEGCLPLDELLFVQELNYRISVLETFQNFCKTAPVTTDTRVMSFHYQLVDAYTRFLMNERKFGLKTDENGQKKRETAFSALERVIQDTRKRFSSFVPGTQDQYKKSIIQLVNTILPVWLQYRNTYIEINV